MHRTAAQIITSIMLAMPATHLGAEPSVAAEATAAQQLAQINATMREIVTLLERQIEGQETDLLIKRIELSSRGLAAKKERLRKLRATAADLDERQGSFARTLEASEQELSEAVEDNPLHEVQLEQLRERLKSVADRQRDLERELVVLENEVRTEEEDMEVLEAVLDERLDLR